MLHAFAWMFVTLFLMAGFQAWQASGGNGIGAFASLFGSQLFGFGGLPLLFVAALALAYGIAWPAIIRRRLRSWYRDEGLTCPFTGIYRFEPGGLWSSGPGQSSATACRRIAGVTRAREHLLIQLKDVEDAIALPLRALEGGNGIASRPTRGTTTSPGFSPRRSPRAAMSAASARAARRARCATGTARRSCRV